MKQEKIFAIQEIIIKTIGALLLISILAIIMYACFRHRPVPKVPPIQFDKFVSIELDQTVVTDTLDEPLSQTYIIKEDLVVDSFRVSKEYRGDYRCTLVLYMGKLKQEIEMKYGWISGYQIGYPDIGIVFGQYNHDNFKDFKIYNPESGNGWLSYYFFLFNPETYRFELSQPLTEQGSLYYNRKSDLYQAHTSCCYFDSYYERFELRNGKIIVKKAMDIGTVKVDSTSRLVRKLIIGRDTMVKVFKKKLDNQDDLYELDPVYRDFIDFERKRHL